MTIKEVRKMNAMCDTECGRCWFNNGGQCLYRDKCDGRLKWSGVLQGWVPVTHTEPHTDWTSKGSW